MPSVSQRTPSAILGVRSAQRRHVHRGRRRPDSFANAISHDTLANAISHDALANPIPDPVTDDHGSVSVRHN